MGLGHRLRQADPGQAAGGAADRRQEVMNQRAAAALGLVLAFTLAACGEKAQTVASGSEKKVDVPGWQPSNSVYLAPGWTPGDRTSWEAQLRTRAQAQNDFAVPTK